MRPNTCEPKMKSSSVKRITVDICTDGNLFLKKVLWKRIDILCLLGLLIVFFSKMPSAVIKCSRCRCNNKTKPKFVSHTRFRLK